MTRLGTLLMVLGCLVQPAQAMDADGTLVVASKSFNESMLLGEVVTRLLRANGLPARHQQGLGGTLVCWEALRAGEVDIYVEYTGTVAQAILDNVHDDVVDTAPAALNRALRPLGAELLEPLGFNNTYAIAVHPAVAEQHNLAQISDLRDADDLALAVSHEFLERADGWPGLAAAYGLQRRPRGIEHGLAYQAIDQRSIDATDAYSTDGDLARYGLVVLDDDRGFFPEYLAAPMVRLDLPPAARAVLLELGGRLDDQRMRALNARVVVDRASFAAVAADWLASEGLAASAAAEADGLPWAELGRNTAQHLKLTGIALGLAVLLGLPLGLAIHRSQVVSRVVLYVAGLLQTIPSIALLALMIPLFGIGEVPAIIALFLYSLLPILRNTVTAMLSIDPVLRRVAEGMGLSAAQQVRHLLLPMALPNILAGVRVAAVISIGTATLAAFIGAGGLGDPIVTGLNLNDPGLILQGAVPAAGLAVLTELLFEGLERVLVPAHMRGQTG